MNITVSRLAVTFLYLYNFPPTTGFLIVFFFFFLGMCQRSATREKGRLVPWEQVLSESSSSSRGESNCLFKGLVHVNTWSGAHSRQVLRNPATHRLIHAIISADYLSVIGVWTMRSILRVHAHGFNIHLTGLYYEGLWMNIILSKRLANH